MTHAVTNPHEEAARLRKAYKLADCAQAHELPLELLEEAGDDFWKTCAEQAGCNPPSRATIDLVISIVRKRSAAARVPRPEQRPAPTASKATNRPANGETPAQGRSAARPSTDEVFAELDASYRADDPNYRETGYDDPFEGLDASPGPWSGLG